MKRKGQARAGERGVALVLVAISMIAFFALVGLAMDAGHLYVTRQRAQAAADAGAQAGVMDMYNGTGNGSASAKAYAKSNGFDPAVDTVDVAWPNCRDLSWCNGHVTLAATGAAPNLIQVTVSRVVNTTFLRALSITSSTVTATAFAGISYAPAAIPIVVTHPHLVDAFLTNGSATVTITGGPTRAIQINSDGTIRANGHSATTPEAFSVGSNAPVNLSQAGPLGTGADFRSWGPGAVADTPSTIDYTPGLTSCPTWLCLGSTGNYIQPASLINDPFAVLSQPSQPAATVSQTVASTTPPSPPVIPNGNSLGVTGCSATCTAAGGCQVYQPGTYTGGIKVTGSNVLTAYFYPGLYYIIDSAKKQDNVGFQTGSNADMRMLSTVCPNVVNGSDPDFSSGGMLVFNHGSAAFDVGSNGNANLVGADWTSTNYEGILFWEDRTLTTGLEHKFGGGGNLILKGTVYINMPNPDYNNYQGVTLHGNSGNTTKIIGEIITNVLQLGGTGDINMQLSSNEFRDVRAVAFVQ